MENSNTHKPEHTSPVSESTPHQCQASHHQKLHKFLKKTAHRLTKPLGHHEPHHEGVDPLDTKETHPCIFERSIECNNRSIINPEIPQHYTTEDYTTPILDHSALMLNDPSIGLNNIKLNCYGDDQCSCANSPEISRAVTAQSVAANQHASASPHNHYCSDTALDYRNRPCSSSRSRSRSIISASLMSSLDNNDHHDHHDQPTPINPIEPAHPDHNGFFNKVRNDLDKYLISPEETEEDEGHTIQYYSYADIVNNEDDDTPMTYPTSGSISPSTHNSRRKGSSYTISLKDYIGTV